jgi:membrane associated rhomboid family serine protease
LLFNMLFLWIFGNNVEDRMGRPGYALFYAVTGVISALAFVAYTPSIDTPLVGASGAVSGILGAYLFLFPTARVYVWVILFVLRMPALVFLPIWFLLQIFGFMNDTAAGTGNVAWISHIAGFLAGVLLFKFFAGRRPD